MLSTTKKILVLLLIFTPTTVFAQKKTVEERDYFASLRSNETNVRAGPGQNYPIKFTFKAKGVPVRVISEYDNWNEIEDFEGQSGWVSQNLLTKRRTLLVFTTKNVINMHAKSNEKARILYHLENNVVLEYIKCEGDWCNVEINDKKGWVKKTEVYGE